MSKTCFTVSDHFLWLELSEKLSKISCQHGINCYEVFKKLKEAFGANGANGSRSAKKTSRLLRGLAVLARP